MYSVTNQKQILVPALAFSASILCVILLYAALKQGETTMLANLTEEKATKVGELILGQLNDRLAGVKRMARRWEAQEGTPYEVWKRDVNNFIADQVGLTTMEWVDETYHVRWAEPLDENQKAIGLDIRFDAVRAKALENAEEKGTLTLTPPLELTQGYKGVISYAPLYVNNKFNGYLVGIFDAEKFLASILRPELTFRWVVDVQSNGQTFFHGATDNLSSATGFTASRNLRIANQSWTITVAPTEKFLKTRSNSVPELILGGGLIFSIVLGFCVYLTYRYRYTSRLLMDVVKTQRDVAHLHHDLQRAMDLIVETTQTITDAESSIIEMVEDNKMVYRAASGSAKAHLGMQLAIEGSLSGMCMLQNTLLRCDDTETDPRVNREACRKIGVASMIVVPLTRQKEVIGVLKVFSSKPRAFNDRHVAVLSLMAGVLSAAFSDAMAHENLRRSEETFRSAMVNATIGMALVSPEGKWLQVNPAICNMMGYSEAELLKLDFQTLTYPDDLNADLGFLQRMMAGEIESYQMEKRYFHKYGHIVWALLSVSMVRDHSGALAYFIAQIQDVTERRKLNETLQSQATLLQLAQDAIFVRDRNDKITFWNKGAELTYGWYKEDIVDRVTHDILQTSFPKPLEEILQELERDGQWSGELVHTKKNGQKITVASRWAIQRDEAGAHVGTLEINRDITERKIMERKLVDSNAELERFAYVASHDMQEPLRMVSGLTDIVVKDYADKLDDEGKNYLTAIRDSSERMRAMIRDLLDYARIDKGTLSRVKVNGDHELQRALENLSELIREKDAKITADPLPEFSGIPIQFMRLLQNLITNAIKYQPAGQRPLIHIGVDDTGEQFRISVNDNGIGIPAQFAEKIFEPFRRLHSWDDVKGTGLGLSVCKKIVENHGGIIGVTSTAGKGSTFHFTLDKVSSCIMI